MNIDVMFAADFPYNTQSFNIDAYVCWFPPNQTVNYFDYFI